MSCAQVRESLLEHLGEPDGALPGELRLHLEGCAACREELAGMRETWAALGRMGEETSSGRMRARFHAMLAAESAAVRADGPPSTAWLGFGGRPWELTRGGGTSWWTPRPAWQAGLLAAALLAGVILGVLIGSRRGGRAEIEELRAEMRSMTQAVTLSLLQHQSASERLRGVGLCEAGPPDENLVQALLRVVQDDPSANVRLAALDVLGSLPVGPDVRASLIESFPRQESPPVKAAMAALLLEIDGSSAAEAVRAAAADDRLPDSVRQYLHRILAEKAKAEGAGT